MRHHLAKERSFMESLTVSHPHPGSFVREKVIPSGMTVKEAAKRLGIGRKRCQISLMGILPYPPRWQSDWRKRLGRIVSNC